MKLRLIIDLSENKDGTHCNQRFSRVVEIAAGASATQVLDELSDLMSELTDAFESKVDELV